MRLNNLLRITQPIKLGSSLQSFSSRVTPGCLSPSKGLFTKFLLTQLFTDAFIHLLNPQIFTKHSKPSVLNAGCSAVNQVILVKAA